jgi:hypothetical protein
MSTTEEPKVWQDAPTVWPEGSELESKPMIRSERAAWLLGYQAGIDRAMELVGPDIAEARRLLGKVSR